MHKFNVIYLMPFCFIIFSCNNFKKNKSHRNIPDSSIANGKILATKYCQSCHMLPDPCLLDAKNWETGVLPGMGPRLGIFRFGKTVYPNSRNDFNVDRNYYPSKPVITTEQWQSLIDYYTALSPDTLPGQQRQYALKNGDALFKAELPSFKTNMPTTCYVHIDTLANPRQVIISDMMTKNIFRFNNQLQFLDSIKNPSPVVDIEIQPHDMITCNIGVMNPNNGKYGSIGHITKDEKNEMKADSAFKINGLARPVQVSSADFNADGKTDYLICEFGNLAGALSWLENMGNNKYQRHVLRAMPGSMKVYIQDVNHDGLPDIWALFSQGDEGIFLFTNKGNGKFDQQQIMRFQPIYGSTYFEFADFNKDGFPDIVYTCGDNADYSITLKPYHGVYIYLNDGTNHFKQQYFFPINGCFKAMARDFDGDGDLDIAAISFFADYAKQPEESIVYLENKGNFDFQPYTLPFATAGRWLTMDAADIDGDGMTDLLLGNFSIAAPTIKLATTWKSGPPFIVLKNIMKKK